ncbi:MAG: SDR family NAD(P)-dependent oxidoreductase [bacterium]
MQLQGKVAIVTGAGRGIGRAIAKAFAEEGASVALVSRTTSQLEDVAGEISKSGGRAAIFPADVSDRGAVESMVKGVEERVGPVDILMNNAGAFFAIGPVFEVDPEAWWGDVTINLFGTFLCCRAVLPGMIARRRGRIINMIGGGTGNPFPYGSGYACSKAGVMRLTECLAQEVRDYGVSVFAMGPGLVRTAMTEYQVVSDAGKRWLPRIQEMFERGRDVPPERAARLAVFLAAGGVDELTGRLFGVGDDLGEIRKQMDEIIQKDLRTLRIRDRA